MSEPLIRRRSLPDSLRYLAEKLNEPLSDAELEDSAGEGLKRTFGVTAMALAGSSEFGELTQHEAGPLGGYLFCTDVGPEGAGIPACGWVDEWTTGFVLGLDSSAGELAEQLLAMRNDMEKES